MYIEDKMSENAVVCDQCASRARIITYTLKNGCVRVRVMCTNKNCGYTEYMDKSKFDEILNGLKE